MRNAHGSLLLGGQTTNSECWCAVAERRVLVQLTLRPAKEAPFGSIRGCHLWYLNIVHQAQAECALPLELGTRSTCRQHDHFPWPQPRQQPLDNVALGV